MDLTKLKWTKNVNREDGEWADRDMNRNSFNLHWILNNISVRLQGGKAIYLENSKKFKSVLAK